MSSAVEVTLLSLNLFAMGVCTRMLWLVLKERANGFVLHERCPNCGATMKLVWTKRP